MGDVTELTKLREENERLRKLVREAFEEGRYAPSLDDMCSSRGCGCRSVDHWEISESAKALDALSEVARR